MGVYGTENFFPPLLGSSGDSLQRDSYPFSIRVLPPDPVGWGNPLLHPHPSPPPHWLRRPTRVSQCASVPLSSGPKLTCLTYISVSESFDQAILAKTVIFWSVPGGGGYSHKVGYAYARTARGWFSPMCTNEGRGSSPRPSGGVQLPGE